MLVKFVLFVFDFCVRFFELCCQVNVARCQANALENRHDLRVLWFVGFNVPGTRGEVRFQGERNSEVFSVHCVSELGIVDICLANFLNGSKALRHFV